MFTHRTRSRQPQANSPILLNRGNPLTRELVGGWLAPGHTYFDDRGCITGHTDTGSGWFQSYHPDYGVGYRRDDTFARSINQTQIRLTGDARIGRQGATLLAVAVGPANTGERFFVTMGATSNGIAFAPLVNNAVTDDAAAVLQGRLYVNSATRYFGGSFTLPQNSTRTPVVVATRWIHHATDSAIAEQSVWLNGEKDPLVGNYTGDTVGLSWFGNYDAGGSSETFFMLGWYRALSDDEIRSISADPYQIFKQQSFSNPRLLFAEAGGTNLTLAVGQLSIPADFAAVNLNLGQQLPVDSLEIPASFAPVDLNLGLHLPVEALAVPASFAPVTFSSEASLAIDPLSAEVSFAPVDLRYAQSLPVDALNVPAALADVGLTLSNPSALTLSVDPLSVPTTFVSVALRYAQTLSISPLVIPVQLNDVNFSLSYVLAVAQRGFPVQFNAVNLLWSGAPQPVNRTREVGYHYVPAAPPTGGSVEDALKWALQELEKASTVINNLAEGRVAPLNAPPAKLFDGMIRMADGVNWNPGNGRGYYGYDAATGTWKFFG